MTAIATDREKEHALNTEAQTQVLEAELASRRKQATEAQQKFCELANEWLSVGQRISVLRDQFDLLKEEQHTIRERIELLIHSGGLPETGVMEIDGETFVYVYPEDRETPLTLRPIARFVMAVEDCPT